MTAVSCRLEGTSTHSSNAHLPLTLAYSTMRCAWTMRTCTERHTERHPQSRECVGMCTPSAAAAGRVGVACVCLMRERRWGHECTHRRAEPNEMDDLGHQARAWACGRAVGAQCRIVAGQEHLRGFDAPYHVVDPHRTHRQRRLDERASAQTRFGTTRLDTCRCPRRRAAQLPAQLLHERRTLARPFSVGRARRRAPALAHSVGAGAAIVADDHSGVPQPPVHVLDGLARLGVCPATRESAVHPRQPLLTHRPVRHLRVMVVREGGTRTQRPHRRTSYAGQVTAPTRRHRLSSPLLSSLLISNQSNQRRVAYTVACMTVRGGVHGGVPLCTARCRRRAPCVSRSARLRGRRDRSCMPTRTHAAPSCPSRAPWTPSIGRAPAPHSAQK